MREKNLEMKREVAHMNYMADREGVEEQMTELELAKLNAGALEV